MKVVPVPGRRSTTEDTPSGLQITIPTKKNWFLILFMGFWLGGWLFGGVSAPAAIISEGIPSAAAMFIIFWLGGWIVGGCLVAYVWLWSLVGKEVIIVGNQHLTIKRDVLGFGRVKRYESSSISNVRLSPEHLTMWDVRSNLRFWGIGGGNAAFDYGSSTIRIGNGVDESEASTIVDEVADRLPKEVG